MLVITSGDVDWEKDRYGRDTSTVFDGRTSQAYIDSSNARDLSGGAFAGGITRSEATRAVFNKHSMAAEMGAFRPLRFPLVLKNSLQKVETASMVFSILKPAVETKRGMLEGDCGGSLSYSIDFIDQSKFFDGRFSFENYCDHGIAVSGETDLDGTYGIDRRDFTTAHFYFANLTDGHITLDGEISIDFMKPPITATFSALGTDIKSGQVYWIKDYSMNITEFAGHAEIEIFGKFYHPDYGFVNLTTAEPLIVHDEDEWPASGLFVIQGEKNTRAELSALDQLRCSVAADTDGDDVLDWDSGILDWTDM